MPHQEHSLPCPSCGATGTLAFCPQCGEHAVHEGDLSLPHLTHDFLHEFTHLDGKIWRTLRALLLQPGLLTSEYWAGRRGLWIRPLRLFLVISALTLFLAPALTGPLGLRTSVTPQGDYIVGASTRPGAVATPIDQELSHRISRIYLTSRYLSLAVLAATMWLAYRRRQPLYGAHLIAAMNFYSFGYLVSGALAWIGPVSQIAIPFCLFVYLVLSLRRIYAQGWLLTFFKSLPVYFSMLLAEMLILAFSVGYCARFAAH